MDDVRQALLAPLVLHAPGAIAGAVQDLPGVYAWYFSPVPPGVPDKGCHAVEGYALLYVGRAGTSLRKRLRKHCRPDASRSTLRLSLGCLLAEQLGIVLMLGQDKRFTFGMEGELRLTEWMARHARVVWHPTVHAIPVERALLADMFLPLNVAGVADSSAPTLSALRRQAKARARELPMVPACHGRSENDVSGG